ncbi:hypothetical protein [Chryseobacterium herbae]|uniref:SMODS and SLOG-associating 2TM effector domain-containing protein n=1 Tax=Chryseobacterium herbae TaxID=2976476 RepID=A0ABT2ISR3_9FLAO|nr:hypothetical protein [Chryseobacterium sp. pc1-10]MCT2561859.1 hypothetical protein [Chryseobacterium sp. pc1-10]
MTQISEKPHTILFVLLFAAAITFYSTNLINANAFLGSLVSIGTIYYGSLKLRIENDLFFKDLFRSFNERYDADLNDLINELRIEPTRILSPTEKNKIIDYFNLCAEEFLWKKKNRIPKDVWEAWRAGIHQNLEIHQIRELYAQETDSHKGRVSYYGLYEELNR